MDIATGAVPSEGGAAAAEAVPRNLREELIAAMKACTPKQRRWLKAIPEHNFQPWGAGDKLGFSTRSIAKWLRDAKVAKVRELLDEIAVEDMDLTQRRILAEYAKLAFSDIRKAFDDHGKLNPPADWPDEFAGAVASIDTQERRILDDKGNETSEFERVIKLKFHDKRTALDFLASFRKMTGAKRIEVTGKDGTPLAGAAPVIQFVERADPD